MFRFFQKPKIQLQRGELRFELPGGDKHWSGDVVTLKLLIEDLEKAYQKLPAAEFLPQLAAILQQRGLEGCTATMAHQIWVSVRREFAAMERELTKQLEGYK